MNGEIAIMSLFLLSPPNGLFSFRDPNSLCLLSVRSDLIKLCGRPITEINYTKCNNYLWKYLLNKHKHVQGIYYHPKDSNRDVV